MWTDTELDRALDDQPPGPAFSPAARARALSRLQAERKHVPVRGEWPRRRLARRAWAVAASVAVVAGVAFTVVGARTPAASAAAVVQLDRAAAATSGGSTALGQYFYTEKHEWVLASAQTSTGKNLAQLQETMYQSWVPHERSRDWIRISTVTGKVRWLVGDEDLVRREGDGGLLSRPGRTREAGPCGDYPSQNGQLGETAPRPPCGERPGDWYEPAPPFLAGLPDDPDEMYQRLRDDNVGSPADMLPMAAGVLAADAPAATRSLVYRALTRVPGLDVTSDAVNLDGHHGVGLGMANGGTRLELVIDPDSGRLIGQRLVLTRPGTGMWAGLPPGTVAEYTAVTTGVADSAPR